MVKNIKAFFLLISQQSSTFAADFKILCDMKKFIYFLFFATVITLAGCSKSANEPTKSAVAIKGHTYRASDGSNYISFYFASNFTCSMTANVNGEYTSNSAMTYKIDANNVDIYRDHSSYWQEAYRGSLLYHLVYYPADDALVLDGNIFRRVN